MQKSRQLISLYERFHHSRYHSVDCSHNPYVYPEGHYHCHPGWKEMTRISDPPLPSPVNGQEGIHHLRSLLSHGRSPGWQHCHLHMSLPDSRSQLGYLDTGLTILQTKRRGSLLQQSKQHLGGHMLCCKLTLGWSWSREKTAALSLGGEWLDLALSLIVALKYTRIDIDRVTAMP